MEPPSPPPPILPPSSSPSKLPLIIASLVGLAIFLIGGVFISVPTLKHQITKAVLSLPFIPKRPLQILRLSSAAHKQIAKNSFDFSLALTSGDFQNILGSNNLDVQATGFSDYTDPLNPRLSVAVSITKDFSLDLRKVDKFVYLKVNKIPLYIYPLFGLEPDKINPLLANWMVLDTSPLQTEARQNLEKLQKSDTKDSSDQAFDPWLKQLLDEDILPKLSMSKTKLDSTPVYKFVYKPTPDEVDSLIDKISRSLEQSTQNTNLLGVHTQAFTPAPSEVIRDPLLTFYIGQSDYYVRKAEISFTLHFPQDSTTPNLPLSTPQKVTFVGVMSSSDFGVDVPISLPESALPPQAYYQQFVDITGFTGLIPYQP